MVAVNDVSQWLPSACLEIAREECSLQLGHHFKKKSTYSHLAPFLQFIIYLIFFKRQSYYLVVLSPRPAVAGPGSSCSQEPGPEASSATSPVFISRKLESTVRVWDINPDTVIWNVGMPSIILIAVPNAQPFALLGNLSAVVEIIMLSTDISMGNSWDYF